MKGVCVMNISSMESNKGSTTTHKPYKSSIDIKHGHDPKRIIKEYNNLCDTTMLDYKKLAKIDVDYRNASPDRVAANLRTHNAVYTLAMISNVVSVLDNNDLTLQSLFEMGMTYNMLMGFNPDVNMDMSRLFTQIRDSVYSFKDNKNIPMRNWPIIKNVVDFGFNTVGNTVDKVSNSALKSAIDEHIVDGRVDDLVMTPRQVACLKINFAEQCYDDMRKDPTNQVHIDTCMQNYNTAIDHLTVIAANSGYDMNAVLAEEKYIVSVKMQNDKNYANMFEDTYKLYGSRPVMFDSSKTSHFDGRMETADCTPCEALVVRQPISDVKAFNEYMSRCGEQLGLAVRYLHSSECNLSEAQKDKLVSGINSYISDFEHRTANLCKNDKLDGDFMSEFYDSYKNASKCDETDYRLQMFSAEFNHVACKAFIKDHRPDLIEKNGVKQIPSNFAGCIHSMFLDGNTDINKHDTGNRLFLSKVRDAFFENGSDYSDKAVCEALRDKQLSKASVSDVRNLLLHTCNNMEQGFEARGSYGRVFEVKDVERGVSEPKAVKKPTFTKNTSADLGLDADLLLSDNKSVSNDCEVGS